jgi:hypothetical protein
MSKNQKSKILLKKGPKNGICDDNGLVDRNNNAKYVTIIFLYF